MIDYKLDKRYIVRNSSTSRGCQIKYYKDGYWYKINKLGYENLAEFYSALLLKYTYSGEYVEYELCTVNGKPGCRSRNFLKKTESLHTFQHIYEIYHGRKINNELMALGDAKKRYQYVVEFMKYATGLDVSEYLTRVMNLDLIILNEDRHFDNLAVIYDEKTSLYREAPVFDNGMSLLSDYGKFEPLGALEDLIGMASAATFSGSFEQQVHAVGFRVEIKDVEGLKRELDALPDHRCKEVLLYQLRRYGLI